MTLRTVLGGRSATTLIEALTARLATAPAGTAPPLTTVVPAAAGVCR
ncbi:hypothetical protein [Mycobacterium decipiens]|nr:hypothetical protein [Mycobacterium decipiens]